MAHQKKLGIVLLCLIGVSVISIEIVQKNSGEYVYNVPNENNIHKRYYVYETSVRYLVARALHVAMDLKILSSIEKSKTFLEFTILYLKHGKNALADLVKVLHAYKIFSISSCHGSAGVNITSRSSEPTR